jgi:AhpD family alkylhydroperoxidase
MDLHEWTCMNGPAQMNAMSGHSTMELAQWKRFGECGSARKDHRMSTIKVLSDAELPFASAEVFADIRATRKTDVVNNFWRSIAHDPVLLKRTWESVKEVMRPGALDPLTKELIYIAVSVTSNCEYCIRSHTAAARAKGMTDQQLMELVAVVGMASETNRLATGLQVPVDEMFMTLT